MPPAPRPRLASRLRARLARRGRCRAVGGRRPGLRPGLGEGVAAGPAPLPGPRPRAPSAVWRPPCAADAAAAGRVGAQTAPPQWLGRALAAKRRPSLAVDGG